jgi:hypothetical protein
VLVAVGSFFVSRGEIAEMSIYEKGEGRRQYLRDPKMDLSKRVLLRTSFRQQMPTARIKRYIRLSDVAPSLLDTLSGTVLQHICSAAVDRSPYSANCN